jgi:radical SAM protein with 4Fe4S-binding SPASM domain
MNIGLVQVGKFWSFLFRKPIVLGLPYAASIEPSNTCNLRCLECPIGQKSSDSKKPLMELNDFKLIIHKLSSTVCYLMLYFQGEPLMNKQISAMVSLAKMKCIFVSMSTNGHYLNENMCRQLIQSGLDHLIISVDGLSQSSYESYRKGGNLELVKKHIHTLVAMKRQYKSETPFITVQFLVTSANEHEMPAVRKWQQEAGFDALVFKSIQIYDVENYTLLLPSNPKYRRYEVSGQNGHLELKNEIKNCSRIWTTTVIDHQGNMVPCCYDKKGMHVIGNLKQYQLKDLWKSGRFNEFRQKVLNQDKSIEICRNCIG